MKLRRKHGNKRGDVLSIQASTVCRQEFNGDCSDGSNAVGTHQPLWGSDESNRVMAARHDS